MITPTSVIELDPELVNLAYEMGLNVSKTCENALKEAIRRLQGSNLDYTIVCNAEVSGWIVNLCSYPIGGIVNAA